MKKTEPYIAVVGAGAIGGLMAAKLQRAGRRVLLVSSRTGAAFIKRRGLTIVTRGKKRVVRGWLEVTHRPAKRPGCAAVLLCVKQPRLADAVRAIRPLIAKDTVVISLLNGVAHIDPLRRTYGRKRLVLGVAYYAGLRRAPTVIEHTGGALVGLGRGAANGPALRAARELLEHAGWHVKLFASEERLLWTKMVFNASVNPLGALAHATNGRLAEEPALRDLLRRVVEEAAGIASAAGRPPLYTDVAHRLVRSCRAASGQLNSMAQDLAAGRRSEADSILLPLLKAARRTGRPAKHLSPLYRMVRLLERELA